MGLGEDQEGILILNNLNPKIGEKLDSAMGLDDTILTLKLTPNRGDCLSHIGVAR